MQTFLPYPDFERCAYVLDDKRLGKQSVEGNQILGALLEGRGWGNHPATLMWRGAEAALVEYQLAMIREWQHRGFNAPKRIERLGELIFNHDLGRGEPLWVPLGARFHRSHRSNLLRKDPTHYRRYWPKLPDDLPYVWPTHEVTE